MQNVDATIPNMLGLPHLPGRMANVVIRYSKVSRYGVSNPVRRLIAQRGQQTNQGCGGHSSSMACFVEAVGAHEDT